MSELILPQPINLKEFGRMVLARLSTFKKRPEQNIVFANGDDQPENMQEAHLKTLNDRADLYSAEANKDLKAQEAARRAQG